MSYNDFLGLYTGPDEEEYERSLKWREKLKKPEHDYDNVRFGMPKGVVKRSKHNDEISLLVRHFISNGYRTWPSSKLSLHFKKHVALFRASLDLWEALCGQGCMTKEEIYFRCLTEGPAFTEWVKKSRAMSFKAFTAETNVPIEEEYLLRGYKGYNSIIHERYLIHWDDIEDIDDVKYAFLPSNKIDEDGFRKRVRKLFDDFRIGEIEFPETFDMIGALKNTVMYDPNQKKTHLMRHFWKSDIDPHSPYMAVRRVVPVAPGGTRDTGVGDPGTILKVKQLNMLSRVISEKLPYCANAPEHVANARLKRVLKRNSFLHLDFKKFGLTFPRSLMNIMIEEIGRVSGIDTSHLIINQFFIEIDGECFQTERGTVLGWLDCINCLCVCAILHWLSCEEELGFDFISFNDDVEISKFVSKDIPGTLELLRLAIVTELNSYDIAISLDKTFGSKGSVFLERYAYFDQYGLDMYKEQLTVKAYSQSLVTAFPWQAKLYHSAAEQWTKSEYATDRCIKTCPVEFRLVEASTSLWSGGWFIYRKDKLDRATRETDELGYLLGLKLSTFKTQSYSTRVEKVTSNRKIYVTVNEKCYNAESSQMARLKFEENRTLSEINSDIDLYRQGLETLLFNYEGRNEQFPLRISWLVERSLMTTDPGG